MALIPLSAHSARWRFSALQRAEIAEIPVLVQVCQGSYARFSALQRAEIAEIAGGALVVAEDAKFQCSSTSRNC